jgi:hypothetical protein
VGNQRVLLHRGRARLRVLLVRTPSTRWVPDVPRPIAGTVLPDVTLPDTTGADRRLADLPEGDPLVLHTYRGWFCPKERAYFRQVLLPLQEVAEVGYVRWSR